MRTMKEINNTALAMHLLHSMIKLLVLADTIWFSARDIRVRCEATNPLGELGNGSRLLDLSRLNADLEVGEAGARDLLTV